MKFTIVVVMLAMAFATEASVISWAPRHSEWSAWGNGLWNHHNSWDNGWHGDWHGDHHHASWDDGHHHGGWASHGPVATHGISLAQGSAWDHHHNHHHSAPAHIELHHAHGHIHAPVHHHDHHHDGHYVAKTLGAVHTAPLPGHIDSVKSINVAPAPGTH